MNLAITYYYLLCLGLCLSLWQGCSSPPASRTADTQKQAASPIQLLIGGKPVLTYHVETVKPHDTLPVYYSRSGYVHPLQTPSGAILTDGFPVGHTHQHGLFMTWVNVTFKGDKMDFWNQHQETGTVRHKRLIDTFQEENRAGLTVELEHVSLKHGPALLEERSYTVSEQEGLFVLDVLSKQRCATEDTVHLNTYHYGGFAFRGNATWNEENPVISDSMRILTSEGKVRHESNHTRPEWIAAYGEVDGKTITAVFMGHPDNFRFPQPIRVHPQMPYLVFTPVQLGGFSINPGEVYESRYRVLTMDGQPDAEKIQGFWEGYRAL